MLANYNISWHDIPVIEGGWYTFFPAWQGCYKTQMW